MKKTLYIIGLLIICAITCHAQDEDGSGDKVRERMKEYLQKKLDLSSSEADHFGPVFLNYFNDLKKTNQDFKGDKLVQQQKLVELRLHYRDEFKKVMGEKRSNDIFNYERDFINEVKKLREERLQNKTDVNPTKPDSNPNKRSGG